MRRFVFRPAEPALRFEHQAREMQEKLAAAGYQIALPDLIQAWDAYSDGLCATWIDAAGQDGEDIFRRISDQFEEVEISPGADF